MSETCTNVDCIPELGQNDGCFLGHSPVMKCPHYKGNTQPADNVRVDTDHVAVGWYGSAFGMRDLDVVAARGKQHIVGIVGPQNSGKTSFLAALYLMLSHGDRLNQMTFAGSYTFNGWEKIARNLRFNAGQSQPHFPPHTPRTTDDNSRVPGLLHLAFRTMHDHFRDFLFTDPPGEWFNHWAINKNDPAAVGAQWIARNATTFAFFVDCERLSGNERGVESGRIERLAKRLGGELEGRAVAIVWAKSDIEIKDEVRNRLQKVFQNTFPNSLEFDVAAIPSERKPKAKKYPGTTKGLGVLETVNWLCKDQSISMRMTIPDPHTTDPFLGYRGTR